MEKEILCALKDQDKKLNQILSILQQGSSGSTPTTTYSWCTACASNDNRLIRIRTNNITGTVTYWEANTPTQVTGITAIKCYDDPAVYNTLKESTVVGTNAGGTYPNPVPSPFTIPANTIHGLTWTVLKGTARVQFGSQPIQTFVTGQSFSWDTNRGLIPYSIVFTDAGTDVVISIKTQS